MSQNINSHAVSKKPTSPHGVMHAYMYARLMKQTPERSFDKGVLSFEQKHIL